MCHHALFHLPSTSYIFFKSGMHLQSYDYFPYLLKQLAALPVAVQYSLKDKGFSVAAAESGV